MNIENNKIENSQPKLPRQTVDQARRSFARLGVAAPVIMTLASKPVFAVQGLSNMLSTHGSATCRGDDRYGGMSPGFWKTPSGSTDVFDDKWYVAWGLTGYAYADNGTGPGNFKIQSETDGKKWNDFVGGTPYSTAFGTGYPGSLREVLNNYPGSNAFHLIAGLLNARYFDAKVSSGGHTQYIFTEAQFWQLLGGHIPVPSTYGSLVDLISLNYHKTPHSCST